MTVITKEQFLIQGILEQMADANQRSHTTISAKMRVSDKKVHKDIVALLRGLSNVYDMVESWDKTKVEPWNTPKVGTIEISL